MAGQGASAGGSLRLPTRRADWRLMGRTARLVLGGPAYAALAIGSGLVALTGFVGSQNLTLVGDLVVGGSLPVENRVSILVGLYPFLGTSYSALSGVLLVGVAALVGVDLGMLAYHVREHGLTVEGGGSGSLGVVLGMLGAGCAACGSAILAGVLSLVGAAGAATLLPLDGLEFALLALATLVLSIHWLAQGMRGGEIRGCPVDI